MVEMLVVIAIFGIVTTILLFNLPTFRNQTSLDLVAQEAAITIRGAQVFGGGGRVGLEARDEAPTYGIYLDSTQAQFDLFRDLDGDGYDNPGGEICAGECVERYALAGGFAINPVKCLTGNTVDDQCDPLNILFTRPALEPKFLPAGSTQFEPYDRVEIEIKSLRDERIKTVNVWANGQIATDVGLVTE